MNLNCTKLDTTLSLEPNMPIALTIEQPVLFAEMVQELFALTTKSSKMFLVTKYGQNITTNNAIIVDYINLSIGKASISALQKSLTKKLNNNALQFNDWIYTGFKMLQELSLDYTADISIDTNCKASNIFKLYDVSIECDECDTLIAKLVGYINCMVEFESLNVLILINPKDYLSRCDYAKLIKHCSYKEVCLLTLQSHIPYSFVEEQTIIVDRDLCEIVDKQVRL